MQNKEIVLNKPTKVRWMCSLSTYANGFLYTMIHPLNTTSLNPFMIVKPFSDHRQWICKSIRILLYLQYMHSGHLQCSMFMWAGFCTVDFNLHMNDVNIVSNRFPLSFNGAVFFILHIPANWHLCRSEQTFQQHRFHETIRWFAEVFEARTS